MTGMNSATAPRQRGHSYLADAWAERLGARTNGERGDDWFGRLRTRATEAFRTHGLPGNKDEAWKYTSLRRLEDLAPDLRGGSGDAAPAPWVPPVPRPDGYGFRWCGGAVGWLEMAPPDGVTVTALSGALGIDSGGGDRLPDAIAQRVRDLLTTVDVTGRGRAFQALNTALLGDGVVIHVDAGVDAGDCLALWALPGGKAPGMHNLRVCVLLEPGARLRLIEQHGGRERGAGGAAQALNLVVQVDLAERAELDHVRVQAEAEDGLLLTFTDVRQAAASRYRHAGFDAGGGLVRHAIDCRLDGEGAHAAVQGAFVTDGERHVDYHIAIDHRAPETSSDQFVRAVLGGHSRGVFNGKAVIRAGADGSRVQQSNANLLLSREAEMDTKPELEIYADEVEARHGATVGQLDETAVFYLRSRGLDEAQARRVLTTAFCRAVADRLDDRELAEPIAALLEAAMPAQEKGHER